MGNDPFHPELKFRATAPMPERFKQRRRPQLQRRLFELTRRREEEFKPVRITVSAK
jgi:hypothetical protein